MAGDNLVNSLRDRPDNQRIQDSVLPNAFHEFFPKIHIHFRTLIWSTSHLLAETHFGAVPQKRQACLMADHISCLSTFRSDRALHSRPATSLLRWCHRFQRKRCRPAGRGSVLPEQVRDRFPPSCGQYPHGRIFQRYALDPFRIFRGHGLRS